MFVLWVRSLCPIDGRPGPITFQHLVLRPVEAQGYKEGARRCGQPLCAERHSEFLCENPFAINSTVQGGAAVVVCKAALWLFNGYGSYSSP